jgi:hypothetical protein
VIAAFATEGIDAAFDETTPDSVLLKKVKACAKLKAKQRDAIASHLREAHQADIEAFTNALTITLTRAIEFVYVLPLHGEVRKWKNVDAAIEFIDSHDESSADNTFVRYEIGIRYGNGDEVRAQFQNKLSATDFLRSFRK